VLVLVLAAAWWYLAVLADQMLAALWCSQVGLDAQARVALYVSDRPMAAMRARAVLCVWRVAMRPQAALALCL
jgi:hypothetical protein